MEIDKLLLGDDAIGNSTYIPLFHLRYTPISELKDNFHYIDSDLILNIIHVENGIDLFTRIVKSYSSEEDRYSLSDYPSIEADEALLSRLHETLSEVLGVLIGILDKFPKIQKEDSDDYVIGSEVAFVEHYSKTRETAEQGGAGNPLPAE